MSVLIISTKGDIHAVAVATLAQKLGLQTLLWTMPDVAGETHMSVKVSGQELTLRIGGEHIDTMSITKVWNRRRVRASIPNSIHQNDREFAFRENSRFWKSVWPSAIPHAKWIADSSTADCAEEKLRQIQMAARAGFNVPPSLFTNDESAVRDFIHENETFGRQTIYKTFTPASWAETGGRLRVKHTTLVTPSDLENTDLSITPGLFQTRIGKSYEVRANFFGDHVHCVRIDSQSRDKTRLDWRSAIDMSGMIVEQSLPVDIEIMTQELLRRLELDMACLDFIVDEQGDYWFLELNQQGQFLWIEEQLPNILLLSRFTEFLYNLGYNTLTTPMAEIFESDQFRHNTQAFQNRGVLRV